MEQEAKDQKPIVTFMDGKQTEEWINCPDCGRVIKLVIHREGFIEVIK